MKRNLLESTFSTHEVTKEEVAAAIDQTLEDQYDAEIAAELDKEMPAPRERKSGTAKTNALAVMLAASMMGTQSPILQDMTPPWMRRRPPTPSAKKEKCLNPPCNVLTNHKKGYCCGDCHRDHSKK